ncbi:hypothetical protein D920_00780 [Enterococcus faecalis 13-SD-W-01]|nr:hypothetical protein D920_00780 [Enterococcus faecalis 13-SD-W-01]
MYKNVWVTLLYKSLWIFIFILLINVKKKQRHNLPTILAFKQTGGKKVQRQKHRKQMLV